MNALRGSAWSLAWTLSLLNLPAANTGDQVLLAARPVPGQSAVAWGGKSTATITSSGVWHVNLEGGLGSDGAFLTLGRNLDFSSSADPLYLALDVRGRDGGEVFSLVLHEGSAKDDREGYQSEANLPSGFQLTTQWQRLVIPLSEFPKTGENWNLPAPPGSSGPLRKKLDWSHIDMFGIERWAGSMTLDLRNIVVSAHPETESCQIISPPQVPASADLSRGAPLVLNASFTAPVRWAIRITQGPASKAFAGLSEQPRVEWDGAADQGEFKAGPCQVELRYGTASKPAVSNSFNLVFPHSPCVQVSQTGYAPGDTKIAAVMGSKTKSVFRVVDAQSGKEVLHSTGSLPVEMPLAGEWVASLDFSSLHATGDYYVEVEGVGRSYPFRIRPDVYGDLLQTTMKSYYFQRCGIDLVPEYAGPYVRKACHTSDAWVYGGCTNDWIVRGAHRKSMGGWHDAGDYGKKIVAASDALGYLLTACEIFPGKVRSLRLGVPGPDPLPDMLREIKFELVWMLTMQEDNGGVEALITSQDFFLNGMPDADPQPRFFTGLSTCATADFAAVLAQSARIYRAWDKNFADECLAAARRAWEFLQRHPEMLPAGGYHDPPGIHGTGTYDDSDDRDERFRAACELFVTTGEASYEDYVRQSYKALQPELFEPPGYLHSQGFGIFSYLLGGKGAKDLTDIFKEALLGYALLATESIERSPYGIAIERHPHWWNNSVALESSAALIIASRVSGDDRFSKAALRQLQSVLGCNPTDRCYVTGFGCRRVLDPWQPASFFDGISQPIPGFVLPGPNLIAWDLPMQRYQEVHGLPPLRNYLDDHHAASVNEVCLNFNGPFVLVAAQFAP